MDCPEFVYRAAQLWEYPVILACILLLVSAFTSAYWNEGIVENSQESGNSGYHWPVYDNFGHHFGRNIRRVLWYGHMDGRTMMKTKVNLLTPQDSHF